MDPTGPIVPRRRLGERLSALRSAAGLSQHDASGVLRCSISKVQKIEAGDVGMKFAELTVLFDAYRVTEAERAELLELYEQGQQRGWWAAHGAVPAPLSTLLGMESAATSVRIFEPLLVPEPLRTPAYERALADAGIASRWDGVPPDRLAALAAERRQRLLASPTRIEVILDEAVLRRPVGGAAVLAEQLAQLADAAPRVSLRVVPLSAGGHPGLGGPLTLFDFAGAMGSTVGLVTSHTGLQYVEKEPALSRCVAALDAIAAAALSPADSLRLLHP